MEVWTDLICERPVRARPRPGDATVTRLIQRLDATAAEFSASARRLRHEGRLDDVFPDPDGPDFPSATKLASRSSTVAASRVVCEAFPSALIHQTPVHIVHVVTYQFGAPIIPRTR